MNESEAIRIAKHAADEVGYPWNPASVAASRCRALFVFPVWRVTSALQEGNYIVRATIPDRATHATQLEMLSTHRASPDIIRRRIGRVVVQAIFAWFAAFSVIRHFVPSSVFRDIAVATGFTLLSAFVTEICVAQYKFRRGLRNNRNA